MEPANDRYFEGLFRSGLVVSGSAVLSLALLLFLLDLLLSNLVLLFSFAVASNGVFNGILLLAKRVLVRVVVVLGLRVVLHFIQSDCLPIPQVRVDLLLVLRRRLARHPR